MKSEDFPILFAGETGARRAERTTRAIRALAEGMAHGEIHNVDYQDAKSTLGNAIYEAWKASISEPFFYSGQRNSVPEAVQAAYDAAIPSSLHNIIALNKRVSKLNSDHQAARALRDFAAQLLPLAQTSAYLKQRVVMGRKPNPNPPPPNPNKLVGTCPCCFREIAVQGNTMAHHGYERPGDGHQTASCAAAHRFKPLEVSSEGLAWLIGVEKDRQEAEWRRLSNKDAWTSLWVERARKLVEITPADPSWPRIFAYETRRLTSSIEFRAHQIEGLESRLADWKPQPWPRPQSPVSNARISERQDIK